VSAFLLVGLVIAIALLLATWFAGEWICRRITLLDSLDLLAKPHGFALPA